MADALSMSMCGPCEEPCEITVKNTFVHLSESRLSHRRSSSVPCSARLASPTSSEKGNDAHFDSWADASTAESEVDADHESVSSSQPAEQEVPESPTGESAKRTPLRSCARAWTPGGSMMAQRPMVGAMIPAGMAEIGYFMHQLTTLVGAAVSALCGSCPVYNVAAAQGPMGWSISAQMRTKDVNRHRERALTVIKNALLETAAASANIFVSGYMSQPFTDTPKGFVAEVVMAPHPNEACWNMLKNGHCKRGGQCWWKHPTHQTTVNVMIQVDDSV